MKDGLLGLPVMRDEDMPPGWLVMRDAADLLGLSPFDGFCSQDTPGGGQAYWRVCREADGTTGMALVHGPGAHPTSVDEALGNMFRGGLSEVRAYLQSNGVDVDADPMIKHAFRATGDA
jgi:hypothetical protein